MPDYSFGKIYTIRCRSDKNLVYVGSTIQSLAVRWGGHKRSMICCNSMVYRHMREKGVKEFFIELYELYPCSSKEELRKREGEVI